MAEDTGPRGFCVDYWKSTVAQLQEANIARNLPINGDDNMKLKKNDLIAHLAMYDSNVPSEYTRDIFHLIQHPIGLTKDSMMTWATRTFPGISLSGTKADFIHAITTAALDRAQKQNDAAVAAQPAVVEAERGAAGAPAAEPATFQQHATPADHHMQGNTPPLPSSQFPADNHTASNSVVTPTAAPATAPVAAPVAAPAVTTAYGTQAFNPFASTATHPGHNPAAVRPADFTAFRTTTERRASGQDALSNIFATHPGPAGDTNVFAARLGTPTASVEPRQTAGSNIFNTRPGTFPNSTRSGTAGSSDDFGTRLGTSNASTSPDRVATSNMFTAGYGTPATSATSATPANRGAAGEPDHYQAWARGSIMSLLQQAVRNDPAIGQTIYEGSEPHRETAEAVREMATAMAEYDRHRVAADRAYRQMSDTFARLTRQHPPRGQ